jgi:hypothetical protein
VIQTAAPKLTTVVLRTMSLRTFIRGSIFTLVLLVAAAPVCAARRGCDRRTVTDISGGVLPGVGDGVAADGGVGSNQTTTSNNRARMPSS